MQELKSLTINLEELKDVNESTIIEPIASNFDACYDAGYSLDKVEVQFKKMAKSVGQTMACMASAMYQRALHIDVSQYETDQAKQFAIEQASALELKQFLGECGAAANRYKKKHNRPDVPLSTTQAKKDIKAAWEAGVDLLECATLYKMRKGVKDLRDAKDLEDDQRAMEEFNANNPTPDEPIPLNSEQGVVKDTEAKATIKVEGIDPSSALGVSLKELMDSVVNAHNNTNAEGDAILIAKLVEMRSQVGKTVAYIAKSINAA